MNLSRDLAQQLKLFITFDLQSSQDQIPNQACPKPENSITQFNQPINPYQCPPISKSILPTINSVFKHQIKLKSIVKGKNFKIKESNHERKKRHFLMSFQNSHSPNKSSNSYTATTKLTFLNTLPRIQHSRPQSKPFFHSNPLHSMIQISKLKAKSTLKKLEVR